MQINAGRAAKTGAEIRDLAERHGIQIVAIQEPYTIKGRIASFGNMARTITGEGKGETAWAAVIVFDPKIVVMRIDQLSDSHIVCVQIDDGNSSLYLICGYFQYSHPIGTYLDKMERIIRHLHGNKIIICVDANAKSPMWYSQDLTDEVEELESLVMDLNLYVGNEASELRTYSRPGGEGNIDVTLATESVIRMIKNWKIREKWISSDHNAITFEVASEARQTNVAESATNEKFMTNKANWESFDKAFVRKTTNLQAPNCKIETIELARKLRRALVESCRESMPLKGKPRVCARWWSVELTEMKREVQRLRKKFQKAKKLNMNPEGISQLRLEYHNN